MKTEKKGKTGREAVRQRTESFMKELEEGVRNVYTSENWMRFLSMQAKFHHYSYSNAVMIMCQKPDATRVAGFRRWKELGRTVKKGEHGIRILAPRQKKVEVEKETDDGMTETEIVKRTYFSPVYVFDVSQTEGEELPDICRALTDDVGEFSKMKAAVEQAAGCTVSYEDFEDAGYGYYDIMRDLIVVRPDLPQAQQLKTLLHETAHSILHRNGGEMENSPRDEKEVQAESIAFITLRHFGIEADGYSFEYIASWGSRDLDELKRNLSVIQRTSERLIGMIEERLYGKEEDTETEEVA